MKEIARERRRGERSPFNPGLIYVSSRSNLMQTHAFEASVEKVSAHLIINPLKKLPLQVAPWWVGRV